MQSVKDCYLTAMCIDIGVRMGSVHPQVVRTSFFHGVTQKVKPNVLFNNVAWVYLGYLSPSNRKLTKKCIYLFSLILCNLYLLPIKKSLTDNCCVTLANQIIAGISN